MYTAVFFYLLSAICLVVSLLLYFDVIRINVRNKRGITLALFITSAVVMLLTTILMTIQDQAEVDKLSVLVSAEAPAPTEAPALTVAPTETETPAPAPAPTVATHPIKDAII